MYLLSFPLVLLFLLITLKVSLGHINRELEYTKNEKLCIIYEIMKTDKNFAENLEKKEKQYFDNLPIFIVECLFSSSSFLWTFIFAIILVYLQFFILPF